MTDIILELIRMVIVGLILITLLRVKRSHEIRKLDGWSSIMLGFSLLFFGTIIDITDNFSELNQFLIVGNTSIQAFVEKVIGYLLGFIFLYVGIKQWLPKVVGHQEMMTKSLDEVNKELKTLQGLLPICASCKKIKDDDGYWEQIENYIADHSEAGFSYSICPDCTKELYPDAYQRLQSKKRAQKAITEDDLSNS